MSHFFGTDGIRGKAGEFLTYEFIKEVGYSISLFIKKNKLEKKVLIGYDTRESSEFIVYTLTSIFLYYGINVDNCGICSTPCISYLSRKYSLSLMVTASHNSFDDNGIKVFLNNGQKIPPTIKDEIEMNMFLEHEELYSSEFGKLHFRPSLIYDYQSNLMSHFPHFKYKGKLLIDCANGGILNIINEIIERNKNKKIKFYITFDIDCLDVSYVFGTGTPQCNGLTPYECDEALRNLHDLDIAGFDIVELNPKLDDSHTSFVIAEELLYHFLAFGLNKEKLK